jgi:predicted RNA-binding Zn-ribbon protein involved in translation (DUF1610 family)
MSTIKNKISKRKSRKNKGGKFMGKLFQEPVSLRFEGKEILCPSCGENNYNERTSTFDRSKIRKLFGLPLTLATGFVSYMISNTSIITYYCNFCGNCRIFRNRLYPSKIQVEKTANTYKYDESVPDEG